MVEFSVVKESEAPRPTKQSGRLAARMREFEKYIDSVPAGRVGKLVPTGNETPRGIALRVSRAGKRKNRAISTWVVDGTVYYSVS